MTPRQGNTPKPNLQRDKFPLAAGILGNLRLVICWRMVVVLLCLTQAVVLGLQKSASTDAKDCTVGNPQPIITKAKDVVVIRKESHEVVEQLQLSPQTRAEVTQAGCDHYALKMAFTFPAAKSVANVRTGAEAIRLLRAL